jgi:hypothetical protein
MTSYQERETALQGIDVQAAANLERKRYVIIPTVRSELVDKPEALLSEGTGKKNFIGSFEPS